MKNLQTIKQSVQKGFTLIELMIVVAIIGILAALAIPAYTDYTIKSRVAEGASLMGATKTALELHWSENGSLASIADDTQAISLAELEVIFGASEYVSSISNTGSNTQPIFTVEYKKSTSLGLASETCVEYVPIAASAGANLVWQVRAKTAYDTAGGTNVIAAVCAPAGGQTPNKYKPKI